LTISFVGAFFHFPPETTNFGWVTHNRSWIHCDQSFMRNELECIQSCVNAYDTNEGVDTFTVLEASNKYHKQFDT